MNFRRYSTSASVDDIKKADKERQAKNKFKLQTQETIKIMVVSETGGSPSVMTLMDANKLAKKKGLNLVHIKDPAKKPIRTEKEVYKMVSRLAGVSEEEIGGNDGGEEDPQKLDKTKQQEVKTVLLKSNTGEHDVNSKINIMKKWITKGNRIRVVISQTGDKGSTVSLPTINST